MPFSTWINIDRWAKFTNHSKQRPCLTQRSSGASLSLNKQSRVRIAYLIDWLVRWK